MIKLDETIIDDQCISQNWNKNFAIDPPEHNYPMNINNATRISTRTLNLSSNVNTHPQKRVMGQMASNFPFAQSNVNKDKRSNVGQKPLQRRTHNYSYAFIRHN